MTTSKTQISALINGSKSVRRDLSNPKYINAPKSTSFGDYAGSNNEIRKSISDKVFSENGETLNIKICGINLILQKQSSGSGKTNWFSSQITEEQFIVIAGYERKPFNKHEGSYSITINNDMTVVLHKSSRRNEKCTWKFKGYDYVGEEFVTIL
jgi:hypothetical protein